MTPELWLEARRVCERIWDGDPDGGRDALPGLCADDPALRALVAELLEADRDATAFLEEPPSLPDDLAPPTAECDLSGATIGAYTVVGRLGAGGMGEVYLARQRQPSREVALKILPPSAASDGGLLREAEALGRLSHPCIAQVYESGVWTPPAGGAARPFIAMERVDGTPLTAWSSAASPSLDECVRVFIRVCEGIAHAHQRGVIHRDIKPSNVLITTIDGVATPKVIDFGIARFAEPGLNDTLSQDGGRRLVGTVPYMSPEQVRGDGRAIDTRTDVYALGALLYELLTGRRPFGTDRGVFETMRAICDEDLAPPRSLRHSIPPDLDAVIRKAMEKSPEQRYGAAGELAADLRRVLAHEPVAAPTPGGLHSLRRFIRRNRVAAAGVAAVVGALSTGLAIAAWQAAEARRAAALAENRLRDVREIAGGLIFDVHDSIAELPGSTAARALLVRQAIEFLDRIVEDGAARDPAFLVEVARSYIRLGDLQGNHYLANVGDAEAAWSAYARAIALLESQPALLARHAEVRRAYADALMGRGLVTNRPGEIYEDYLVAWDIRREIVERGADVSAADLLEFAKITWRLGSNYCNTDQIDTGLSVMLQGIEVLQATPTDASSSLAQQFAVLELMHWHAYQSLRFERRTGVLDTLRFVVPALMSIESRSDAPPDAGLQTLRALADLAKAEAIDGAIDSAISNAEEAIRRVDRGLESDTTNALALRHANSLYERAGEAYILCARRTAGGEQKVEFTKRAVELQKQSLAFAVERRERGWLPEWESHYVEIAEAALAAYQAELAAALGAQHTPAAD